MDSSDLAFYDLRFTVQYLEAKGASFQDLFVSTAAKAARSTHCSQPHPAELIRRTADSSLRTDRGYPATLSSPSCRGGPGKQVPEDYTSCDYSSRSAFALRMGRL